MWGRWGNHACACVLLLLVVVVLFVYLPLVGEKMSDPVRDSVGQAIYLTACY